MQGKVGDKEQKFDFPATFVEKSSDESFGFIEKLWAVRRVGEILDELDLKGKNDELVRELVELATRHGILTPYTSFMADENVKIHDFAANSTRAEERLYALARIRRPSRRRASGRSKADCKTPSKLPHPARHDARPHPPHEAADDVAGLEHGPAWAAAIMAAAAKP